MDNYAAASGVLHVTVGGRAWPVPVLAARYNKIIDPLILMLLPVFTQWQTDRAGALAKLGGAHYDALLEIAFVAITCLSRELTREVFLDLPITLPELISAFNTIALQTGIFQKENTPGEAAGAESPRTDSPTGTESSPIPAI